MMPLSILYQDDYFVAINKPAKLLVHRSPIDKHETQFVIQLLKEQLGKWVYPIHRLDKPTSGVLILAFDPHTAHQLSLQFENQTVEKTYWAVVRGYLLGEGVIDYAFKPRVDTIADKFKNNDPKPAITAYQNLATLELPFSTNPKFATSRYSWLSLTPKTGRKHQLRRHLTHLFHPIVGDTTYGDTVQNKAFIEHFGVNRLLLHARQLTLIHPTTNECLILTAPVDDDFENILTSFHTLA